MGGYTTRSKEQVSAIIVCHVYKQLNAGSVMHFVVHVYVV